MPTATPTPATETKQDRIIRQRRGDTLSKCLQSLIDAARKARDRSDDLDDRNEALKALDDSHQELKGEQKTESFGRFLDGPGSVVAAYAVDLLLLASVAEFLTAGLGEGVRSIAQFLVPACVITGELVVSSRIYRATQEAAELEEEPRPEDQAQVRKWTGIAWAALIGITSLTAITYYQRFVLDGELTPVEGVLILGVALLAVWAHYLVVFGGEKAHLARAAFVYGIRRTQAYGAKRVAERKLARSRDVLDDTLRGYALAHDRYVVSYGVPPDALRIDNRVRELVNGAAGEELIAPPEAAPAPARPLPPPLPLDPEPPHVGDGQATPEPEPPPAPIQTAASAPPDDFDEVDDLQADNDLLRRALDAQVRDLNGEIRP